MWTVDLLTSLSAATLSVWLVHHGGHVTPSEAGRGPAAHHQSDLVAPEPESGQARGVFHISRLN